MIVTRGTDFRPNKAFLIGRGDFLNKNEILFYLLEAVAYLILGPLLSFRRRILYDKAGFALHPDLTPVSIPAQYQTHNTNRNTAATPKP